MPKTGITSDQNSIITEIDIAVPPSSGNSRKAKRHSRQQGWQRAIGWMPAFVETGETVVTQPPISG